MRRVQSAAQENGKWYAVTVVPVAQLDRASASDCAHRSSLPPPCPRRPMDRPSASEAEDAGSIPAEGTMSEGGS